METPPLTRGRLQAGLPHDGGQGNTPAYAGKTEVVAQVSTGETRNTPAYAGKTVGAVAVGAVGWKHPRLRGEDSFMECTMASELETPPLTRGRPGRRFLTDLLFRNTPAYAGKTGTA